MHTAKKSHATTTATKCNANKRTRANTCRVGAKLVRQGGHCTTFVPGGAS